jgi:hypothetical protein
LLHNQTRPFSLLSARSFLMVDMGVSLTTAPGNTCTVIAGTTLISSV